YYDELKPYCSRAEQLYEVHGARGENPTEPPSSAPYPHPAVSDEPRIQQLPDDLAAAGYPPVHAPGGSKPGTSHPPWALSAARWGHSELRDPRRSRRASAVRPATASRASCTRSPTPRCSAF